MLVSAAKTEFGVMKHDISDVTDAIFIYWADYLNKLYYNHIAGIDAERLVSSKMYNVTVFPQVSALPTNFKHIRSYQMGFYKLELNKIGFLSQTVNFTVGATLTGASSGATATITAVTDDGTSGLITYSGLSGTFTPGEIITDSSLGSATVTFENVISNSNTAKLTRTSPGSGDEGYYITGTNVVFTGLSATTPLLLRYIPTVTTITAVSDSLSIPDEFNKFIVDGLDVIYGQWDEDAPLEQIAGFRFQAQLDALSEDIKREPAVYALQDYSSNY